MIWTSACILWVQLQRVSETDRQTTSHLEEWHHWAIQFPKCVMLLTMGEMAVWLCDLSFLLPQPQNTPPNLLFHIQKLSCILACILNIYLVHVPLTQFLSLGVGRKFSYIPFSFKACIPNGLLHGHFVYTYTPPHGEELVSFTSRHRWLLEISPLID